MVDALLKDILGSMQKRQRDVLARRFGLKNDCHETLEAIGGFYGITRERVRQIESSALRAAKRAALLESFRDFEKLAHEYLERAAGARVEDKFIEELRFLVSDRHPAGSSRIRFLLGLSLRLSRRNETEKTHAFWVVDEKFALRVAKFLDALVNEMRKKKMPLSLADADSFLSRLAAKTGFSRFPAGALVEFVHISKDVSVNPYGEWGLVEWGAIIPSGVKDRAYYALRHHSKPLHFKEIACLLNERAKLATEFHHAWQKRTEVQTIHNELIKDPRFILVGRGMYALREWGYKPGTVLNVITDVLKSAKHPLAKEEIARLVKEKRFVKENTVLINLQNRRFFRKGEDGRYWLRRKAGRDSVVREA